MTVDEALSQTIQNRLRADATWNALSKGVFLIKAKSGTDYPYSTYLIESCLPVGALRTTSRWILTVQMKHWAGNVNNIQGSGAGRAVAVRNAAAKLFHARDDPSTGTSCDQVFDALNAAISGYGWKFLNAELVLTIPPLNENINDVEVWYTINKFKFELEGL